MTSFSTQHKNTQRNEGKKKLFAHVSSHLKLRKSQRQAQPAVIHMSRDSFEARPNDSQPYAFRWLTKVPQLTVLPFHSR